MGAGNFFSGLLAGYTGTVLKNEERAYQQHISAREMDMKLALQGWQDAVNSDDPKMRAAAFANLQRATQALQEPFQYHMGGGKKGAKSKQAQQGGGLGPVPQIAMAGMAQQAQQKQQGQQGQQPMSEQIPTGPQAGQNAQAVGLSQPALAPVPVRNSAQGPSGSVPAPAIQSQVPQTGNQPTVAQGAAQQATPALPQMPQRPATLADVYAAEPSPESQARRQENIREATASQQFAFDQHQFDQKVQKLEALGGEKLSKTDKENMYRQTMGLAPKDEKPIALSKLPVTAGELTKADPSATTFDGTPVSQLDPSQKLLTFFLNGKVLAIPGSGLAGGSFTQSGSYTLPDGSVRTAYRDPKSNTIVDASTGDPLVGGRFVPTAQMPTSGTGTASVTTFGPNGEPMIVQVPTFHTSQKVAPGGGTATGGRGATASGARLPNLPSKGRVIGPKFEALSGDGKKALKSASMGTGMMDRLDQTLNQYKMADAGGWMDSAKAAYEWELYKHHRPTDPPYDVLIPTTSLLRVTLSSAYLQGLRNFNWVEMIGNHLPDVWDPPKLVEQKLTQLRQNLPLLQRAIYENEQPGGPQAAEARKADQQAAQATAGPKKGDQREYKGHTYTFNGKVWVR